MALFNNGEVYWGYGGHGQSGDITSNRSYARCGGT